MDKNVIDQIKKDWGIPEDELPTSLPLAGGFLPGEMVIISTPGVPSFIPRDPDIRRGELFPIFVYPTTQRKSMMMQDEAWRAGLMEHISFEERESEFRKRVSELGKYLDLDSLPNADPHISEKGMEMLKTRSHPIAIDVKMNPDGTLAFGVVPPDADHPALTQLPTFGELDSFSEFVEKKEEK